MWGHCCSAHRFRLAVTGAVASWAGWRIAFMVCSIGVFIGALLSMPVFKGYRPLVHNRKKHRLPHRSPQQQAGFPDDPRLRLAHVGNVRDAKLAGTVFLRPAGRERHGQGSRNRLGGHRRRLIVGIGTFSTAITGTLSDRLGRTRTITLVMCSSAFISFFFGWLINFNPYVTFAVGLVYGYLIVAESPVFSTGANRTGRPGLPGNSNGNAVPDRVLPRHDFTRPFSAGLSTFARTWQPLPGIRVDWGIAFATAGAAR